MNLDPLDCLIVGGTVVTASGMSAATVGIRDGKIVHLGDPVPARQTIDASGKYVLPGGIDLHVHLSPGVLPNGEELYWADDYESGTRAAAAGGITTVGDMCYGRPGESLRATVQRATEQASKQAVVDFVLHPIVVDPHEGIRQELRAVAAEGHTSIKFFMIRDSFDGLAREFTKLLQVAGEVGVLTMVHCEDGTICSHRIDELTDAGHQGVQYYAGSRPDYAEEVAVVRAIGLARAAGAPLYVVHISTRGALDAVRRARADGVPVYAETRPLYLYQNDAVYKEDQGARFVGRPPVRAESDRLAMLYGLAHGDIHTYSTDHAPWQLDEKLDRSLNIGNQFRPGHADLDTLLPQLYSRAVRTGLMSLQRFVEVTSTNAARLFGLFPRKGTIGIGSDADVVIWDLEKRWTIDSAHTQTRSDFSLYEGEEIVGKPVLTLVRGTPVYRDGEIVVGAGHGQLVHRGPTQKL